MSFSGRMFKHCKLLLLLGIFLVPMMASCGHDDGLPVVSKSESQADASVKYAMDGSEILDSYRLGPNDVIEMIVINDAKIDGNFTVDGNGNINLPYINEINVNALSLVEAQQKIIDAYKDGYFFDPKITLRIKTFRPFYLVGEIQSPGEYEYEENISILKAVAAAGGFTYRADRQDIKIIRNIGKVPHVVMADRFTKIMPGDVVEIEEKLF